MTYMSFLVKKLLKTKAKTKENLIKAKKSALLGLVTNLFFTTLLY